LRKQKLNQSIKHMAIREENEDTAPDRVKNIFDQHVQNETNENRPDPTAKRNIGPFGETERRGQKDKLKNMHIGGNEVTGYGANDPDSVDNLAQGPGYEVEGSFEEADGSVNGIRSQDQPFGGNTTEPNENEEGYRQI
jgi:hypothetical protein